MVSAGNNRKFASKQAWIRLCLQLRMSTRKPGPVHTARAQQHVFVTLTENYA